MLPATKRGLRGSWAVNSRAASFAMRAAFRFSSYTRDSKPNSASPKLVAVKVLVVRMSAPASR